MPRQFGEPPPPEMILSGPALAAGYYSLGAVSLIPPPKFQRLLNVRTDRGSIDKRGGYSTFQAGGEMSGSGSVNSLYATQSTSARKLVAAANTRLFGIALSDGTVTVIKTGAPSAARYDFCEFDAAGTINVVGYTSTGGGYAFSWDSAAAGVTALVGPGVACNVVMSHSRRIWAATGRTIYITNADTIDTYVAGYSLTIKDNPEYGNIVKMVSLVRNFSLIMCERGIYTMTGSDPGTVSGTPNIVIKSLGGVGCCSNAAVVKMGEEVYFFGVETGQYGIFVADGADIPRKLTREIEDDLDTVATSYLSTACAVQLGTDVLFAIALGAATDTSTIFVIHRETPRRPFVTWQFAKMPRSFARDMLTGTVYFGRQDLAHVAQYLPTTYNDSGTAIDMDVITGPFMAGMERMDLEEVEAHAKVVASGSVAVSYGRDDDAVGSFTAFDTSPWSTASSGTFMGDEGGESYAWQGVTRYLFHSQIGVHAQSFRFRFRENSTNNCSLYRIRAKASPKKER